MRSSDLRRGEIYRVRHPQPGDSKKSRCFAVVSRQDLLDSKANRVLCAPINTSGIGMATEVEVGIDEGLKHPSVINCEQISHLEKRMLTDYVGELSLAKLRELHTALQIAFDIDYDLETGIAAETCLVRSSADLYVARPLTSGRKIKP